MATAGLDDASTGLTGAADVGTAVVGAAVAEQLAAVGAIVYVTYTQEVAATGVLLAQSFHEELETEALFDVVVLLELPEVLLLQSAQVDDELALGDLVVVVLLLELLVQLRNVSVYPSGNGSELTHPSCLHRH